MSDSPDLSKSIIHTPCDLDSDSPLLLGYANLLRLRTLPKDKRAQGIQQIQQKAKTIQSNCKPAPPPMEPSNYLTALANLDVKKPDAFQNFIRDTQAQDPESSPKPIPLGTREGIQYFLLSSESTVQQDISNPPKTGDIYYSMSEYTSLSIPQYKPLATDLVYGFGLGQLYYRPVTTSPATWDNLTDSGFFVICSATDKSLWAAFNFNPITELGYVRPLKPENGDPYGKLPPGKPDDQSSVVIGLQKLYGKDWTTKKPFSLDGVDPFKNNVGSGTEIAAKLTAKPVLVADVVRAIGGGAVGA
ncbi:uncharacterized protein KY384_001825 [Bacidia gigantensis]|uniref:uncharacterized protein n=1 Tax=Bacidia gigantensis TaxID=2732470 RepID=UPI001D04106D|nr:uncharacterized protein KY384_001825 [Bacidia gigantensis]KAG8533042.1 hypothetical protein KY384_001825 [Bacidia gigantensis]